MFEESNVIMPTQSLNFSDFEKQVVSCLPNYLTPLTSKKEQIGILILLSGALIAAIAAANLPSVTAGAFAIAGIGIEILGALFVFITGLGKELADMRNRKPIFAADLDRDLAGFNQIISWLKKYPKEELEEKLLFARRRLEPLTKRSSFLLGGVERLGFLPIVAALYLQFKDFKFAWPIDLHAGGVLLGLAVFLLYLIGLWSISVRWQLEGYVRFLEMATQQATSNVKFTDQL